MYVQRNKWSLGSRVQHSSMAQKKKLMSCVGIQLTSRRCHTEVLGLLWLQVCKAFLPWSLVFIVICFLFQNSSLSKSRTFCIPYALSTIWFRFFFWHYYHIQYLNVICSHTLQMDTPLHRHLLTVHPSVMQSCSQASDFISIAWKRSAQIKIRVQWFSSPLAISSCYRTYPISLVCFHIPVFLWTVLQFPTNRRFPWYWFDLIIRGS